MANLNLVFLYMTMVLQEAKKKVDADDLEGAQQELARVAACVANVANRVGRLQAD